MNAKEYSLKWKTIFFVSIICGILLLFLTFFNNIPEVVAFFAITILILITTPIDEEFVKQILSKKNLRKGTLVELFLTFTHFIYVLYFYSPFLKNEYKGSVDKLAFMLILSAILFVMAIPAYSFVVIYLSDNYRSDLKERVYGFVLSDKFGRICFTLAVISILIQIRYAFSLDIIPDEAFSLALAEYSYGDAIKLTAQDVHPPIYYIILKTCIDIVHFVFPKFNVIYIAKLASFIPYILIFIVCNTKVKNLWGNNVASLCMLCSVGFPNVLNSILEIRMYGWSMFFVFSAFLEFCFVIKYEKTENWLLFMFYSLFAAYTHYFACVAVALFYIAALIYFLVKKDGAQLKNWFLVAIFTVLLYLPWFLVLITQLVTIKGGYWIEKPKLVDIKDFLIYAFTGRPMLMSSIVFLFIIIKRYCKKDIETDKLILAISAYITTVWTMLLGFSVSILFKPVFISRYMIPSLLCMWCGFILMARLTEKRFWQAFIALNILCISVFGIYSFDKEEHNKLIETNEFMEFIDDISENENTIFVTDTAHAYGGLPALTDAKTYFIYYDNNGIDTDALNTSINILVDVFGEDRLGVMFSESDFMPYVNENYNIYYVKTFLGVTNMDVDNSDLFNYEYIGRYRLGYDIMDFYRVTAKK